MNNIEEKNCRRAQSAERCDVELRKEILDNNEMVYNIEINGDRAESLIDLAFANGFDGVRYAKDKDNFYISLLKTCAGLPYKRMVVVKMHDKRLDIVTAKIIKFIKEIKKIKFL